MAEPEEKKPFRIQKKRLGRIKFIREDGEFGFIESEDFREDVFFHRRDWESPTGRWPEVEMYVEYELDDDHFDATKKYRAKIVRLTDRPDGRKLSARDATYDIVQHHPNAKRKRPTWRK